MILLLVAFFSVGCINTTTNYIVNGGFENPAIPLDGVSNNNCVDCDGIYDLKGPLFRPYNLVNNQFIDLQNWTRDNLRPKRQPTIER